MSRDHRWSGWPGAYCLDCRAEDAREICAAEGCCFADCQACWPRWAYSILKKLKILFGFYTPVCKYCCDTGAVVVDCHKPGHINSPCPGPREILNGNHTVHDSSTASHKND